MTGGAGIAVYYDGECPFCRSYVAYAKLKERFGEVALVNAREAPEKVAEFLARGFDIDDGFIVEQGDAIHAGADAMRFIHAELAPESTGLSRFANRRFLAAAYPLLRSGRNLALSLLGRSKINAR